MKTKMQGVINNGGRNTWRPCILCCKSSIPSNAMPSSVVRCRSSKWSNTYLGCRDGDGAWPRDLSDRFLCKSALSICGRKNELRVANSTQILSRA